MSASAALFGPVDSASALRCGFASLKPISIKETVKKWGLRVTSVRWRFEGASDNDWVKNYPSYITLLNNSVLEKIKLPEAVDSRMLADMITKAAIERFEKDHELKSALGKVEAEKESAKPFVEFTQFLRKRFEENRLKTANAKAEAFMHSNLPFSYFSNLVMSNEIYEGFLDALQRKLTLYESVWFKRAFNNPEQFKRKFREMQASLSPLFDAIERIVFTERCLNVLVVGSNCKDAASLFSVDFLDVKKIDYQQFEPFLVEFDSNLNSCVSLIVSMEPNSFAHLPNTDLNKVFSELLV
jgi:cell fate (sporulation/competence/biofilm development) regulator YlbF (YheA/YmcA/DUF963 family)